MLLAKGWRVARPRRERPVSIEREAFRGYCDNSENRRSNQGVQIVAYRVARPQLTLWETFFRQAQAIRSALGRSETDVGTLRITPCKRSQRLRVAAWWLAGTFGMISLTSAVADPAEPSRDLIVVEGNRRVEAETVRSYFHATPDGKFDDAARDAAL